MTSILWINLLIGAGAGAVAFQGGLLNLPLSIAAGFLIAAALNMTGLRI